MTYRNRTTRCDHGFAIGIVECVTCSDMRECGVCLLFRHRDQYSGPRGTVCRHCRDKQRVRVKRQRQSVPGTWTRSTSDAAGEAVKRIREERKAG